MDFLNYVAVWAIAYAEAINENVYLPVPNVKNADNISDVIKLLEKTHPEISFNYGIADTDLLHNARATQIIEKMVEVENLLREIDTTIRPLDSITISIGNITPVKLGPHLRSFLRYIKPSPPNFRLGGSNGALTVLKLATNITSVKALAKVWLRNVVTKLDFLKAYDIQINHPSNKQNLPIVLTNERNLISAMSLALNLKNLTQVLLHHHRKKFFLQVGYTKTKFSNFDQTIQSLPYRCQCIYRSTNSLYECTMDLYMNSDDSEYLFIWDSLVNILQDILNLLRFGTYEVDTILKDLKQNPHVLDELVAYYPELVSAVGFDNRINSMKEWEIL